MPNWCTNRLTVSGDDADLERFERAAAGVDGEGKTVPLDFNRILPVPPDVREHGWLEPLDLLKEFESLATLDEQRAFVAAHPEVMLVAGSLQPRTPGVVDWQTHTWGTKWTPARDDFNTIERSPGQLLLILSTAWDAPLGVVRACGVAFPRLRFELLYSEPDAGFAGLAICASESEESLRTDVPDEAYALLRNRGWPEEAEAWRARK